MRIVFPLALAAAVFVLAISQASARSQADILADIREAQESYKKSCDRIDRVKATVIKFKAEQNQTRIRLKPQLDEVEREDASAEGEQFDNDKAEHGARFAQRQLATRRSIIAGKRRPLNEQIYSYNEPIGRNESYIEELQLEKAKEAEKLADLRYELKNPGGGRIVRAPDPGTPGGTPGVPGSGEKPRFDPSKPEIAVDFSYRFQNLPRIDFKTADFNSGNGNTIELGPDDVDGFGGRIEGRIPWSIFHPGPDPYDNIHANVWQDFYFGGYKIDGDDRVTFLQPAGTQQVIGGINGTGTPFALNTTTTFATEYDSHAFEAGTSIYANVLAKELLRFWASFGLHGQYRSTDIDIIYATSGGGLTFNNFTNIYEHEYVFRPTVGLRGSVTVPGTDGRLELSADWKIGPSFHFGSADYSDCGSTDGTGGVCNGGFFRTNSSESSSDVGLYTSLNVGLTGKVTDNLFVDLSGGITGESVYRHTLNDNINTNPGAVNSFGGASQELDFVTPRIFRIGVRLRFD